MKKNKKIKTWYVFLEVSNTLGNYWNLKRKIDRLAKEFEDKFKSRFVSRSRIKEVIGIHTPSLGEFLIFLKGEDWAEAKELIERRLKSADYVKRLDWYEGNRVKRWKKETK